jgi:hypothetical protein
MQLKALLDTCYQQPDYSAPQSTPFPRCCSHQQHTEANASLDTLREQLADVVDEIVSVNNRHKVNMGIKKFNDEALKAHRMMTQVQQALFMAHRECISAIREALTSKDIAQGVNNSANAPPSPLVPPVVNDNVNDVQE